MTKILKFAREQANKKRERRILLPVPGSPGVDLLFRTATGDDIAKAAKGAKRMHPYDDTMANFQMNLALIAACCIEIWQNGETAMLPSGEPATFKDKAIWDDLEASTASDAVSELVGRDGDADAIANAVLLESGFNRDGTPLQGTENPT